MENTENFKMDRSFVTKSSFETIDDHVSFYMDKTLKERLEAAIFIINNIFQVENDLKVDKTVFYSRKHAKFI